MSQVTNRWLRPRSVSSFFVTFPFISLSLLLNPYTIIIIMIINILSSEGVVVVVVVVSYRHLSSFEVYPFDKCAQFFTVRLICSAKFCNVNYRTPKPAIDKRPTTRRGQSVCGTRAGSMHKNNYNNNQGGP